MLCSRHEPCVRSGWLVFRRGGAMVCDTQHTGTQSARSIFTSSESACLGICTPSSYKPIKLIKDGQRVWFVNVCAARRCNLCMGMGL